VSKIRPVHRIRAIKPQSTSRKKAAPRISGTPRLPRTPDLDTPESWRALIPRIGERRVKDIVRLMKQGVMGTAPELCVYHWLTRNNILFEFQSSFYQGKMVKGGLVADFIIFNQPNGVLALEVMGLYWHPPTVRATSDLRKRESLLRSGYYNGLKVVEVVWVDEDSIFDRYEQTMENAIAGISSIGIGEV